MIVNLGLLRGYVGRERCGLMPIRGHSGVQGGAEMGAYATALPGGVADHAGERRARSSTRVRLPGARRARAHRAGDGRGRGARRARPPLLRRRQLPAHPARSRLRRRRPRARAAARPPGHHPHRPDAASSRPASEVLLLPAKTRYEQDGGGTADQHRAARDVQPRAAAPGRRGARRVAHPARARGGGRSAARRPARLRRPARPSATRSRASCRSTTASSSCSTAGESFQYGGPHLAPGGHFPTADGTRAPDPGAAAGRRPRRPARSSSARAAASSSTRSSTPRSIRSPAPPATPS